MPPKTNPPDESMAVAVATIGVKLDELKEDLKGIAKDLRRHAKEAEKDRTRLTRLEDRVTGIEERWKWLSGATGAAVGGMVLLIAQAMIG